MVGNGRATRRGLAAALLVLPHLLSGCADLAESGPGAGAIQSERSAALPYRVVPITAATLAAVDRAEPDRLAGAFPANTPPARLVLGIGDVLSLTIYEAAPGGLFVPGEAGVRPGGNVSLPNQTIDVAGNISFPFGGRIRAAGLTTTQLQTAILRRIRDRAIDPQVVVAVVSQQTSLVSVQGEVRMPQRYPAAASGAQDRVSDALTRAGGLSGAGSETWVSLERGGRRATVPYEALLRSGRDDIFVQPGDSILVYRQPQRFIALGAFGRRAQAPVDPEARAPRAEPLLDGGRAEIPFDAWRLSLAEAVARAGGLLDSRADPGAIFLYRREPAAVAARLGLDPGRLDPVPLVYRLDLSDPGGFLLATRFPMRNDDVLYVANARAAEASKALDYIGAYLSTAVNATSAAALSNSALSARSSTGLPTIGGLTVVPSGVAGQPGTVSLNGIGNGVNPTVTTPTGGTGDSAGSAPSGTTNPTVTTPVSSQQAPRSTMAAPASR